jgi:RNA polymerase sigma-70 factor, ECF subfamily
MASSAKTKGTFKILDTEELVLLAQDRQAGSQYMDALEELVNRYQRTVHITLSQLLPERNDTLDLTQEVLLRMCRSIGTLRNAKTFKYWLNRIITNLFYDELRKNPRRLNTISMDTLPSSFEDEGDSKNGFDIPDVKHIPEVGALGSELEKHIQSSIAALPEQFRTMIVLREVQGLSYEEIASLTQSNLGTVKSRLARARLRLQELLRPYLENA